MTVQEKLQYLDSLYAQNKITEAEEFLLAQTADDNMENSLQVKISLNNELMGIYRNKGNREKCPIARSWESTGVTKARAGWWIC